MIDDRELDSRFVRGHAQMDSSVVRRAGILAGVVNQIEQYLLDGTGIGVQRRLLHCRVSFDQ